MSDMNQKKGDSTGFVDDDIELSADELVAALFREISSEESEESGSAIPEERETDMFRDDLAVNFDDDDNQNEDPDDLIRELQMAVDDELTATDRDEDVLPAMEEPAVEETAEAEEPAEEETVETEEPVVEAEKPVVAAVVEETTAIAEPVAEEPVEAEEPAAEENVETEEPAAEENVETEEPAAEEAVEAEEPVAEETAEAETPVVEEVVETEEPVEEVVEPIEETVETAEVPVEAEQLTESQEEALDEPDPEIQDVSIGVSSTVPTEVLPEIPSSVVAASKKEQKKAEKEMQKEAKKRMKQEAEEAKLRAKQEAKEQKKQKKEEKTAKKKKGAGKIILILLLLLIAAAAIVYLALSNRYKTVFFDGTKINGADCTGLTVEDAETVIARQMDDYDLAITFRDGRKEVISGEDIGFEYVPDGSVQEIKDSQIPVLWLTAFFDTYSYDATAACQFDTLKLSEAITGLSECNLANMEAPEDAHLTYNEGIKAFEIVPEKNGNKFDLSALIEIAKSEILKGSRELNLEELDLYEKPARLSTDSELIRQRDEMNDIIKSSVTYTLPTGTEKVLDADILHSWISQDDQGNYYLDTENWGTQIANFVEDLAKEVNTSDTTAEFFTHNGGSVVLDNYLKGWLIDEEAEGEKLTEELAARAVEKREPIYAQRAYSDDNNGIGNTYVEVDLTAQYLWAVEDGVVVIETPIVSGTMVPSRYTPEGIYPLNGKQEGRWLRGEQYADGTYEYESWVDFWMPFNGGIGLHDASWRPNFGGSTYIGGGSHGCVNMPVGKAEAVFRWITTGTPVVCYYSGGYSLAPDGTYGE